MSLFGAMSTAISGLTAQSANFSNISDNVANSQTTGFKRVDTSFESLLTLSNATTNESGAVLARPDYVNNVQGTINQTDNPLGLAISGSGFFAVAARTGATLNNLPVFSQQQEYTRAGDFTLDKDGYLVNGAGLTLEGWPISQTTGTPTTTSLSPIQISTSSSPPQATQQVTLSANLPDTPSGGAPVSSDVQVYDSLGELHTITLNWTQNSTGDWTVSINAPGAATAAAGSAEVYFGGNAAANGVPSGTIGDVTNVTGTVTSAGYSANGAASLAFTVNYGQGPQTMTLNFGNYGGSGGLTQYAGTEYSLRSSTQDGIPPGAYSGVTMRDSGDVVVNYDNGQSRTVARVPVATFANADALQRQNGQAFTATISSGAGTMNSAGVSGSGKLVTGAVESSNVDIASQFTNLIVAQQAYSASTKVVTTANDMMQQTIDMKR